MAYGLFGAERVFFSSVLFQEAKENGNLWDCPQKPDRCTCMFSGDVPTKPKKNQTKEQSKKLSTERGGGMAECTHLSLVSLVTFVPSNGQDNVLRSIPL